MISIYGIERDEYGWASLIINLTDEGYDGDAVRLRVTQGGTASPVASIVIDRLMDFTPDVLAAIGLTFTRWAAQAEARGVAL